MTLVLKRHPETIAQHGVSIHIFTIDCHKLHVKTYIIV